MGALIGVSKLVIMQAMPSTFTHSPADLGRKNLNKFTKVVVPNDYLCHRMKHSKGKKGGGDASMTNLTTGS